MSKSIKKTVEKIPRKETKKGKTTKQIMTRHIQDKNDVITDEDFKNLNLELDITKDTAHELLVIENNSERPKDEDKDPKVVTPWDVIK
jgi:hypothetical protein